jgi:hypothetical protein
MTFQATATRLLFCMALLSPTRDVRGECGQTTLERDIRNAEIIFAGTVRSVVVTPWTTRYTFEDVRYAKGAGQADSIVLSQMGGSQVAVSIGVSFQHGIRYIVLAGRGVDGQFAAIACGAGHPFVVRKDSGTGIPFVADHRGRMFLAFDSLRVVALYSEPWNINQGFRSSRPGPPTPPSIRPLTEVLNDLDSLGSFTCEPRPYFKSRPRVPGEGPRAAYLFPHQDTGDRVTEDQMLRVLAAVDVRVSGDPPTRR